MGGEQAFLVGVTALTAVVWLVVVAWGHRVANPSSADRYRIRDVDRPFRQLAAALILAPFHLAAAAPFAVLGAFSLIPIGRPISGRVWRLTLFVGSIIGLYAWRTTGDIVEAVGRTALGGTFVLAAVSGQRGFAPVSAEVQKRLIALGEMFCYANLIGLMAGLQVDENRRFLGGTIGGDRLSFAFASGASMAAAVGGATLLIALFTRVPMHPLRRAVLVASAGYIVWGANYRFELAITALLALCGAAAWALPSVKVKKGAVVAGACLVLFVPLWWGAVSGLVAPPLSAILQDTPGLGTRSTSATATEEVRSLNNRTQVWGDTAKLGGRSPIGNLVWGWGIGGGDARYQAEHRAQFLRTFDELGHISSHNMWLEVGRRAGLVMAAIWTAFVVVAFSRLPKREPSLLLVGGLVVSVGGLGVGAAPTVNILLAVFATALLPPLLGRGRPA